MPCNSTCTQPAPAETKLSCNASECSPDTREQELLRRIAQLERENEKLREEKHSANHDALQQQPDKEQHQNGVEGAWYHYENNTPHRYSLSQEQIARFSRHLILPEIGMLGQERLCRGSVLLVGCGGLGSPCAMFLAAAGVGRMGLVDFDVVEKSNLHRQIIHQERREGMLKVESAKQSCLEINSSMQIDVYPEGFNESNGVELASKYDIVVDGSDNVSTRFLVNDACVMAGKPLVSGCAVRLEGQITVYNYRDGPCYRCLYPSPPPAASVTNCADGGVLGVVPGIIGSIQALEVKKVLMGNMDDGVLYKRMLVFNAKQGTFRTMRVRGRQANCTVCGEHPTITSLKSYANVSCAPVRPLHESLLSKNRITVSEYAGHVLEKRIPHVLVDVRDAHQYEIGCIPNAINFPLKQLAQELDRLQKIIQDKLEIQGQDIDTVMQYPIYVVCRRGNASVRGTAALLENGFSNVKNVDGGVTQWQKDVDPEFPIY